ncbi:MAG: sulfurtransferase TusA family protein [Nitrospirae bacterium]|nr:sulfurtransferase TusA family protein [Nitrospirota bacterium]
MEHPIPSKNATTPPAIPQAVLEEIEAFQTELDRLTRGEIHEEKFKRFRLQNGIYGQRQKGVLMIRVKIPNGLLNAAQMECLAEIGETFSNGIGHVTTRQDLQYHWVKPETVPTVMRRLAEVGLTTREACGNTVRNVTACHMAGFCPKERIDVTPAAEATTEMLLRNPICQSLPRKFKIALSGCLQDCAMAPIHDIGLVAVREGEGPGSAGASSESGRIGYRVCLGGGLGSHPHVANLFDPFMAQEDLPFLYEAVIRLFDQYGERRNRSKARMKFLLEKWGWEKFSAEVRREFDNLKGTRPPDPVFSGGNGDYAPSPERGLETIALADTGDRTFHQWVETNVLRQKQLGHAIVTVRLPLGDITARQMRLLSGLAARFAGGHLRATNQQNLILYWVKQEDLRALHGGLKEAGLAAPDAGRLMDIQSCPGAETCNLGLTSSRRLADAIGDHLILQGSTSLEGVRIKVSGCPNSCGHHHIADIGFHGVARKVSGRLVPHYQIHLGGGVGNGRAVIGDSRIKLPARNVPAAAGVLVDRYTRERLTGETFYDYINRVGKETIQKTLEPFVSVPGYEEIPELYRDWGAEGDFTLAELGPGECSGGVIDLMEECLIAAEREVSGAALLVERGDAEGAREHLDQGVIRMANGMLVPYGVDTEITEELLREFQNKIIDKCVVSDEAEGLLKLVGKPAAAAEMAERIRLGKILMDECKEAYRRLDANMKFQARETGETKEESAAMTTARTADAVLDLKGVACPYNFVRTKLKLEEMDPGQLLEVIIDEGEPIKNVPRSVKAEGHQILTEEKIDDQHYRLLIEKA